MVKLTSNKSLLTTIMTTYTCIVKEYQDKITAANKRKWFDIMPRTERVSFQDAFNYGFAHGVVASMENIIRVSEESNDS